MSKRAPKKATNTNNKKFDKHAKYGQAAMEYLMTYGWAILVVLAIIAILAFIVRPQPFETCQVQQPFECIAGSYLIYTTNGTMIVTLKNNGYDQLRIINTSCGYNESGYINSLEIDRTLSVGATYNLPFNCSGPGGADPSGKVGEDVFQKDVYIVYNPRASDTSIQKTTTIKIAAKYS